MIVREKESTIDALGDLRFELSCSSSAELLDIQTARMLPFPAPFQRLGVLLSQSEIDGPFGSIFNIDTAGFSEFAREIRIHSPAFDGEMEKIIRLIRFRLRCKHPACCK